MDRSFPLFLWSISKHSISDGYAWRDVPLCSTRNIPVEFVSHFIAAATCGEGAYWDTVRLIRPSGLALNVCMSAERVHVESLFNSSHTLIWNQKNFRFCSGFPEKRFRVSRAVLSGLHTAGVDADAWYIICRPMRLSNASQTWNLKLEALLKLFRISAEFNEALVKVDQRRASRRSTDRLWLRMFGQR